jgi:uncharacterized damage-inducible protein DinB
MEDIMRTSKWILVWSLMAAASLGAQQSPAPKAAAAPASPITDSIKSTYGIAKDYLTKSAAAVPEKGYLFKPAGVAADVRNFGQIVGHVANANYMFCGAVVGQPMKGETGPGGADYEKTAAKAGLQKALAESFAFCDKAFAAVNDRNAGQAVDSLPIGGTTKLGALAFNNAHLFEHYGNLVTYMRAMGMVPPSSQPAK